jgi:hypothetical protein
MRFLKQFFVNHYGGPESEKPDTLRYGDYYWSEDINVLYKYNRALVPIVVGGDAGTPALIITQSAANYAALTPGTDNGELAYVYSSQGTAWLPGTVGGSYYPAGFYVWDGALWVSDRNAIAEQLAKNTLDFVVKVNSLADFPAPVGGVIELIPFAGANVTYIIAPKFIDVGSNKFTVTGGAVVIKGEHRTASAVGTSATGNMFTCVDANFFCEYIGFACENANWLDWSTATTGAYHVANQNLIIYSCINVARIENAFTTSLRTCTILTATGHGFLWEGSSAQINISQMLGVAWVGNLLDLGTAQFEIIDIVSGSRWISPVGTNILSGLPNSGNLIATGRGIVEGNLFNGDGIALDGIDVDDLLWSFQGNIFSDNITRNTLIAADTYLTSAQTVTVTVQATDYIVNGINWESSLDARFTVGTDGVCEYLGMETIGISISATSTVQKVGGGSNEICTKIGIDHGSGYVIYDRSVGCTQSTEPTGIVSAGFFTISEGDKIALFVANEDGTSDIIVEQSTILMNKLI